MIANPNGPNRVDDLLKRVFADDLPPDVEEGMRDRIGRFRTGAMKTEERPAGDAWTWDFRRNAFAVLSALMLIAGILLQGLGSQSSLGERIAQIKAKISSAEPNRRPDGPGAAARLLTIPDGRPTSVAPDKEAGS